MNYLNLAFYVFFPIFLILYNAFPQKLRYIVIFIGSYIFYGYANMEMLLTLFVITLFSYIGGLAIERKKSRIILIVFLLADVLWLIFFKYTNFIVSCINMLMNKVLPQAGQIDHFAIILPLGLSFIVFQSCTYLTDVYRGNIAAEHNFVRYGAFVAFFPTVLSGPIQKARELMPQIACPRQFDGVEAQKGTLLFVWGFFEKVMVANRLSFIVDRVFCIDDYQNYNSAYYIIAAICFSLYIYADFSAYSDMARGIGKIMGIHVGKNFNNPYLSTTTAEFWNRWHMSLNSWFLENIYIPLGGNRKGTLRKYVNMMFVFLLSGLWHGANWHFVAWGLINGGFVIAGQVLKQTRTSVYTKMKVSETVESIRFCKQCVTFCLITFTWIFFRNGINESLYIIKGIFSFNLVNFVDADLLLVGGSALATYVTVMSAMFFCIMQLKRRNEYAVFEKYARQPLLMQCIPVALGICICIFAACSTDANVNTQFLYFQF